MSDVISQEFSHQLSLHRKTTPRDDSQSSCMLINRHTNRHAVVSKCGRKPKTICRFFFFAVLHFHSFIFYQGVKWRESQLGFVFLLFNPSYCSLRRPISRLNCTAGKYLAEVAETTLDFLIFFGCVWTEVKDLVFLLSSPRSHSYTVVADHLSQPYLIPVTVRPCFPQTLIQ